MKIKKGQEVFICENARVKLGLPDGIIGVVTDILTDGEDYPYVVSSEGNFIEEYFDEEELIKFKK